MWQYFYYIECPACETIHDFMISVSGIYDIEFINVKEDWWAYAKTIGVSKVPSLYNGSEVYTLGRMSSTEIESILTS